MTNAVEEHRHTLQELSQLLPNAGAIGRARVDQGNLTDGYVGY